MVYLARRYFPGSTIYDLKKERTRRKDTHKCRCKIPCSTPILTTNSRKEIWFANSEMARGMKPYHLKKHPPQRQNSGAGGIPAAARAVHRLYCTADTGVISKQVETAYNDVLFTPMQAEAQHIGVRFEGYGRIQTGLSCGNIFGNTSHRIKKASWYRIMYDITPTQERLNKIHVALRYLCRSFATKETLRHRITECGEFRQQWELTRQRVAFMLITETRWVQE